MKKRRSAKWRDAANSYHDIRITYVDGSEQWNAHKQLEEEINIAIELQAIYFYPNKLQKTM